MSMSHRCRLVVLPLVFASLAIASESVASANDPVVQFDVPALVGVHEIVYEEGHEPTGDEKIIEVVISVSSEVESGARGSVEGFRYDIYWNRSVFPLADYSPRTQTVSGIEGLIAVESSENDSAGVGINLNGHYLDQVTGSLNADISKQRGTKRSYAEVPQHEILVASGSVRRGTGAFFRFHPSKRETLEGGRDLVVAFRVPQSWRGGVLKVECRAEGHRKVFGSWRESFESERAFIVPIYLENDDQARRAAFEFVRSEQGLRRNWLRFQRQAKRSQAKPSSVGIFISPSRTADKRSALPNQWVHYLIQSGTDDYLEKYRSRLPEELASAAERFAAARSDLLEYSR